MINGIIDKVEGRAKFVAGYDQKFLGTSTHKDGWAETVEKVYKNPTYLLEPEAEKFAESLQKEENLGTMNAIFFFRPLRPADPLTD